MAEGILSCGACLRRAMRLLPEHRGAFERAARLQSLPLRPTPTQSRFASRLSSTPSPAAVKAAIIGPSSKETMSDPASSSSKQRAAPSAEAPTEDRKGRTIKQLENAVRKNLPWMEDPYKVSEYVQDILKKGQYDEAVILVRKASNKLSVEVSWNHLIQHLLRNQRWREAIKMYNDMKKRGQLPNVRTFSIIFGGLAKTDHPKLVLGEAIRLYHVLLNDVRLEANTIHLNAVLNICARAGDIEGMFTIVETINENTRAADAATYTTILNALRWACSPESKSNTDLTREQAAENINKAITRGKMLWREAIINWRRARLFMDESMVCAFGRLLVQAPDRLQKREVFDLLQQTMNLPNLTKEDNEDKQVSGPRRVSLSEQGSYVKPGNNTLSLILTALSASRMNTGGIKYWNLLVREYGIEPDKDSWMRLFGLLKVGKSSSHIVDMIDVVPDEYVFPRLYAIALQGCMRDNMNVNVMKHSNKIFASMVRRLPLPNPEAMRIYLDTALVAHYQFRKRADQGEAEAKAAIDDYNKQLAAAVKTLWEPYRTLYDHYFNKVKPKDKAAEGVLYNDKREVIAVARAMLSAFGKIREQDSLPKEEFDALTRITSKLNRQIHAFFDLRAKAEPNLPKHRNGELKGADADGAQGKGRRRGEEGTEEKGNKTGRFAEGSLAWDTTVALRPPKPDRDERKRRRGEDPWVQAARDEVRGRDMRMVSTITRRRAMI